MRKSNADQIEIVSQYLSIESQYALIINGKYGIGKTHFFKTELEPMIRNSSLPSDGSKKYIPVHISLFGLKSLQDIQEAIILELYPILKAKKMKLAIGITKSIARGLASLWQLGDLNDYIEDGKKAANGLLNYNAIALCFDDLDRRSEDLSLKDILGFINTLVENQGAKVLIIANDEQLNTNPQYTMNREKVIGVSVQFEPNVVDTCNEIIKGKYSNSGDKKYFNFLTENINHLSDIVSLNENNFRNLIYFLEHFKLIFYSLELNKSLTVRREERLKSILHFTLSVAIEYKLGKLHSNNKEEIKNVKHGEFYVNRLLKSMNDKDKEDEKKTFKEYFYNKYFQSIRYNYYESIFNYILGIKALDSNLLKKELEEYFPETKMYPQDHLLDKLMYLDCLKLSDLEYRNATMEMLKYADEGTYRLDQYATVFHFAVRFKNILNFNVDKLKNRVLRGVNQGLKNHLYNSHLHRVLSVNNDTEFKEETLEIIKYCIEKNDALKVNHNASDLQKEFNEFSSNFEGFIIKAHAREWSYAFEPFWSAFDVSKTMKVIAKLDNSQVWQLSDHFLDRYPKNVFEGLQSEKEFVVGLKDRVNTWITQRKRRTLKMVSMERLLANLQLAESHFPSLV